MSKYLWNFPPDNMWQSHWLMFVWFQRSFLCGVNWRLFTAGSRRQADTDSHTSASSGFLDCWILLELSGSGQLEFIFCLETEWSLRRRSLDGFPHECENLAGGVGKLLKEFWLSFSGGTLHTSQKMDQASGGEDPNKPHKKKSGEDEGRNKKLVGIHPDSLWLSCDEL